MKNKDPELPGSLCITGALIRVLRKNGKPSFMDRNELIERWKYEQAQPFPGGDFYHLAAFDVQPQWPQATPEKYLAKLQSAGMHVVDLQEWSGRLGFIDVGAIVYYLKAVPWLVPGFSIESHLSYLLKLQDRLEAGEELSFSARKYLIEARKV